MREADGTVVGHVRTLRLLTDAEAAVVAERGWDALVGDSGSEEALVDVTRGGADGGAGGAGAAPSGSDPAERRSGPPRDRSVVIRTKMHAEHPPRWVTLDDGVFQSVTGYESPEYMQDNGNHEFVAVETFLRSAPWTAEFVQAAQEGQTALFTDASGAYRLED
ncbi:hypothetical protein [Litorihabitans aurantiacus]|uniref:Uncharacterized protein n=1 Tax=Litorihabitans aurantiacus TaxID=1930061 RepID=A0AA37UNN5_9MICO|nr:hypothetical protein [Litorihabitans aurantiacus]GMA30281.1 hypothetical protein GCM10025875_02730 [Litorihabitans aurantiacus]